MAEKGRSLDDCEAHENSSEPEKRESDPLADFVLMLVVAALKNMYRGELGDDVEKLSERNFEYIGDGVPTGIEVAEDESMFAFRMRGTRVPALAVAKFVKNERGGPDFEQFKGVRLFPDNTMKFN